MLTRQDAGLAALKALGGPQRRPTRLGSQVTAARPQRRKASAETRGAASAAIPPGA